MKSYIAAAILAFAGSLASASPMKDAACFHQLEDGVATKRCVPSCGEKRNAAGPCIAEDTQNSVTVEERDTDAPCVVVEGLDSVKRCVPSCGEKRDVAGACVHLGNDVETRDGGATQCRDVVEMGMVVKRCVPSCGEKKRNVNGACIAVKDCPKDKPHCHGKDGDEDSDDENDDNGPLF
jgi:hypothetical protein